MKNAKTYEKRIKKLLKEMPKAKAAHSGDSDPVKVLIESILAADATKRQITQAIKALDAEFVDHNELRVAQPKEIAECVGKEFPGARRKAEILAGALNGVFDGQYSICLDYMAKM
ncbi:MAG: hypothetical protein KAU28_06660, partial [Phycisphaerae bacterium]|nr:hypothetical protein [Phycisphaerae bacterium]